MCLYSTGVVLRNFFLAGTLLNNFLTEIVVPTFPEVLEKSFNLPPSNSTRAAISLSLFRVINNSLLTDAILGRASPLKPKEEILKMSLTVLILLVA